MSIASAASAADAPRLVYAANENWQTDLLVTNPDASATATVVATNCAVGPSGIQLSLLPGESVAVDDFGALLCGEPIGTVAVSISGTPVLTVYGRFHDSLGNVTAFEMPPLAAPLRAGEVATIPLVRVSEIYETAVVIFNEGAFFSGARIAVFDETGSACGEELVALPPGLSLHLIATPLGIGRLEITQGLPVGCALCSYDEPLYGFVLVGVKDQGAQRLIPFAPTAGTP